MNNPLDSIHPIKIYSATNEIDAGIIMELLLNNNIPCYKKSNATGGYMNIYMGYSVYGEDIYVDEKDYQEARDLINYISNEENLMDFEDDKSNYTIPFYRNPRIISRIILFFIACIVILIFVLNYSV